MLQFNGSALGNRIRDFILHQIWETEGCFFHLLETGRSWGYDWALPLAHTP